MTLTAPTYTIHCDESGCRNSYTFMLSATAYPGLYDLRGTAEVYRYFGGETLPDGKHRCASCRAKLSIIGSPDPDQIMSALEAVQSAPSAVEPLERAIAMARHYRQTESDGTPRLWRGKQLQELAHALDEALDAMPKPCVGDRNAARS